MQNSTLASDPVPTIPPADHASLLIPLNCTQPATASLPMDQDPLHHTNPWNIALHHTTTSVLLVCGAKLGRETTWHLCPHQGDVGSRPPAHPPLSCPTCLSRSRWGVPSTLPPFPHEISRHNAMVSREDTQSCNTCHCLTPYPAAWVQV